MSIFTAAIEAVGGLFKPATELLDTITTTDEERGELKNRALELKVQLTQIQAGIVERFIGYETKAMELQNGILLAEANSESAITRTWRPIAMYSILSVILYAGVFAPIFHLPPPDFSQVPDKLWDLFTWGLGGYAIGRSVEKSAVAIFEAMKKKES